LSSRKKLETKMRTDFDPVGSVAVSEGMDGDVLVDPGIEDGALEAFLEIAAVHDFRCR